LGDRIASRSKEERRRRGGGGSSTTRLVREGEEGDEPTHFSAANPASRPSQALVLDELLGCRLLLLLLTPSQAALAQRGK
jgi:hypothetical protein